MDLLLNGKEIVFEDANLLLAAAVAGQGAALGDRITCARFLEEGALAQPFAATSPRTVSMRSAHVERLNSASTKVRPFRPRRPRSAGSSDSAAIASARAAPSSGGM